MGKIPFKVSARTARLIGRENIATSKGAIIELVKNSSDADSNVCILYFNNKYSEMPSFLQEEDINFFIENGIDLKTIEDLYSKKDSIWELKESIELPLLEDFKEKLSYLPELYIIDSGDGMTQNIITDYWMTIGTDNKAQNIFTKSGKVKAGAKGIGRFALDKLGDLCEMTTKFNPDVHTDIDEDGNPTDNIAYKWNVDWRDFEGDAKTIENVEADLEGYNHLDFKDFVQKICPVKEINKIIEKHSFNSGTVLKISGLREPWLDEYINQLFSDLQVLVPPEEFDNFEVYVFSKTKPNEFGKVEGSLCDDFDYKLVAKADKDQNVFFTIYRHEYDQEIISPNLFKREAFKSFPYTRNDFIKGQWSDTKTFSQLAPGIKNVDKDNTFDKIGEFEFTFYFMKRAYTTPDLEKFNYRKFPSDYRKEWLNKFGGIKLFRDSFRVRPYGETNNSSFDWLGLGTRKSKSPAAISKKEGGYKVEPENIAGAIKISRTANIDFEDKSSREGLQENRTFQVFKEIIQGIIAVFEEDRAFIAREMLSFFNENNSELKDREQAERLAQSILERRQREKEKQSDSTLESTETETNDDNPKGSNSYENSGTYELNNNQLVILAELNKEKAEKIEKLEDEQKILRGLASSGIVIASFTHELGNLNDVMESRINDLQDLILDDLPVENFKDTEDFLNPYILMDTIRDQDSKLRNWLKFSLTAARKDKRKRNKVYLESYFEYLSETWKNTLDNREIEFTINLNDNEGLALRVFEIDLDSIFNNLIVNSIDAFISNTEIVSRKISINLTRTHKEVNIDYVDNGPGLSQDIDKPEKIFEALYTTKRNRITLEEEGTGLGMWLVSSIISDNDGTKKILFPEKGFGLRISLPIKYLIK